MVKSVRRSNDLLERCPYPRLPVPSIRSGCPPGSPYLCFSSSHYPPAGNPSHPASFTLYSTLEDQLALFNRSADRVLTEEQERILDETKEDKRKIFFGAAGTGKSYVAMEKARRLAQAGHRVFLTCYNRALVDMYRKDVKSPLVTSDCYLDHIQGLLGITTPSEDTETFYKHTLPTLAFDHYSQLPDCEKYDAVIVD